MPLPLLQILHQMVILFDEIVYFARDSQLHVGKTAMKATMKRYDIESRI